MENAPTPPHKGWGAMAECVWPTDLQASQTFTPDKELVSDTFSRRLSKILKVACKGDADFFGYLGL